MATMRVSSATVVLSFTLLCSAATAYAGDAESGRVLYASRCAFCHGMSGKGDGPAGKALKPPPTNFTDAEYWKTAKREAMEDAIEHGKPKTAMMAFKGVLGAAQIDDLLAYLQSLKPQP